MKPEELAEVAHQAYLDTARRLGWPIKPENDIPFAELSEAAKELDRGMVRTVLAHLASQREEQGDAHTCEQFDQVCAERDALEADLAAQAAAHEGEIARLKLVIATKGSMHDASTCTHALQLDRLHAAHAQSVREIQVRMVKAETALREIEHATDDPEIGEDLFRPAWWAVICQVHQIAADTLAGLASPPETA